MRPLVHSAAAVWRRTLDKALVMAPILDKINVKDVLGTRRRAQQRRQQQIAAQFLIDEGYL